MLGTDNTLHGFVSGDIKEFIAHAMTEIKYVYVNVQYRRMQFSACSAL